MEQILDKDMPAPNGGVKLPLYPNAKGQKTRVAFLIYRYYAILAGNKF